jgi:hypothetical protein
VCELCHIALPRIDLQRHFLPRLRPVANGGSLFEKSETHDRGRALMKIVLVAAGPPCIALGLFWFGQAAGLLSGLHNAVLIDVGADIHRNASLTRVIA